MWAILYGLCAARSFSKDFKARTFPNDYSSKVKRLVKMITNNAMKHIYAIITYIVNKLRYRVSCKKKK